MSQHKTKYRGTGRNYKKIIYRKLNEFIVDHVNSSSVKMVCLPYSWAQERDFIELRGTEVPLAMWGWENSPTNLATTRRFAPEPWGTVIEGDLVRHFQFREDPETSKLMPKVNVLSLDFCSTLNSEVLKALEMLHWHVEPDCEVIPFAITFCLRYLRALKIKPMKMGEGIPELHAGRSCEPKYAGSARQQMALVKKHLNRNWGYQYKHVGQETYARPAPGMGVMWGLLERV
jgi:hypothetical protein